MFLLYCCLDCSPMRVCAAWRKRRGLDETPGDLEVGVARLKSATGNTFAQYKAPAFNTQEGKMAKYGSRLPPAGLLPDKRP